MRKTQFRVALSLSVLSLGAFAQSVSSLSKDSTDLAANALSPKAYLMPGDISFAHIAVGGWWRTQFFLVNMSSNSIPYTLYFFDDNGTPMSLPIPVTGGYSWSTTFAGTIAPYGENNFTATNLDTVNTKTGQAILSYDHSLGDIGGFSVFQEVMTNGQIYEATVPVSGTDSKLFLPFYHFEGYDSGVALANPSNSSTRVTIQALNNSGSVVVSDTIVLPAYGHTAFDLLSRYPSLNNVRGSLYITSSSGYLSCVGLRFSPTGSYTTIPIMNWTGMF
jgi:hypothetical protein